MAKKFQTEVRSAGEINQPTGPSDWRPVAAFSCGYAGYVVFEREVEVPDPPTPEERQAIRGRDEVRAECWAEFLKIIDHVFEKGASKITLRDYVADQLSQAKAKAERKGG